MTNSVKVERVQALRRGNAAGTHKDRRTQRLRTRATVKRNAVEASRG